MTLFCQQNKTKKKTRLDAVWRGGVGREASSASDSDLERTVVCTMLSDQIGSDQEKLQVQYGILRIGSGCKGNVQCYRIGVAAEVQCDAVAVNNRT